MKKLKLAAITVAICLLGCSKDDPIITSSTSAEPNAVTPPKVTDATTATTEQEVTTQVVVVPQKPNDYAMGSRSYAVSKVSKEIYYKALDIDELTSNPSKFTADYLKSFISIHASDVGGTNFYQFTDEDLKEVVIKEFSFSPLKDQITFKTSYKGVTSTVLSRIEFRPETYYDYKIVVNTDFVSKHYMRGIYEDLEGFIGHLLIYDPNKFDIEFHGDNNSFKADYSDMLRFNFELIDRKSNKTVANITKEITGFKKISSIGTEMKIFTTFNFEKAVREKIKTIKNIDDTTVDLATKLQGAFTNAKWMQLTRVEVNGNKLTWRDDYLSGSGLNSDVYLDSPMFVLESVTRNGKDATLHIKLIQANNENIINAHFALVVRDIK
ncbi:hypothetical protein [Flavobacterium crassostreae]|uniref:Uncharacterized protein n=1 Tax=Flavobacterium crassostreae TaxID=1763534 RepID=A0A1B9E9E4_9FLAO|nr:hypothetical protein [Flavobacterium crassostreae]OCB78552.1 hypothetical protein LPBF_00710 [Flavobacterium crassostreae]